jgi:hypothetical protein
MGVDAGRAPGPEMSRGTRTGITLKPQQTQNAAENNCEQLCFFTVVFCGVLVAAHKAACVAGASPVAGIGCEPA